MRAQPARRRIPILDLSLFRIPTFAMSMTGALLFRLGVGATPFLLPLLLQVGFGLSPFKSGSITFAAAVGAIAMKFAAPPILRRFGFRSVLIWNAVIAGGFVALPAAFTPATPIALITGLLLVGGFFRSLQFTTHQRAELCRRAAGADEPRDDACERRAAIVAVASASRSARSRSRLTTRSTGGAIEASSFRPAFILIGTFTLLSLVPFLLLSRNAGDEMSGRQPAPDPVTVMRERG